MTTSAWEPVLDGPLAEEAWTALRDISNEIVAASDDQHRPDNVALFWAYAAGALDDAMSSARYERATRCLLARLEQRWSVLGLHGGLAGAAWTLAHVGDGDDNDGLTMIDRTLLDALSVDRWKDDYDLIGGLTGLGVYFLERLSSAPDTPSARDGLGLVVAHLESLAEHSEEGVTWHTAPGLLPPWQREVWPDGYYNLGVAHGVPGVIALLARAAALPDPPDLASALCADAVRWMRAQRREPAQGGFFPSSLSRGDTASGEPRTAWCYGDPGVAAALWSAASRTAAPADEWRELATRCAARPADGCRVIEAGLCHGAIGLAHLFNRFYQASRDPQFRTASRAWFERGLAMRCPGRGIAGFLARSFDPDSHETTWVPAPGLVEGVAGIGLALVAGLTGEEPGWDRLLLCDLPPTTPGSGSPPAAR